MARQRVGRKYRTANHPVLIVDGARGSGKTALIGVLAGIFEHHVPHARLDLERNRQVTVPELLSALAFQLGKKYLGYGALQFPRLGTGVLVLGHKLDLSSREAAYRRLVELLGQERGVDTFRELLQAFAADVPEIVQAPVGMPNRTIAAVLQRAQSGVLTRFSGPRRLVLGSASWYGHRDRGFRSDPVDILIDLNQWNADPTDEDNRQRIDQLLCDAFLADLSAAFRGADKLPSNCVLLLDNVDTPLGQRFLRQLVGMRRQRLADGIEEPDPLTVVGSSRGLLSTDPGRIEETFKREWWYRYTLPDLTHDEIGSMVAGLELQQANNPRLTLLAEGLAGGHPAGTRLWLDAVAERPANRDEPSMVLGQPEPGGGPGSGSVAERMLAQQIVDVPEDVRGDLISIAAGRRRTDALRMATVGNLLHCSEANYVALIDPVLWPPTAGAGPALLRTLLLRLLAARQDGNWPNWPNWHEVFDCYRQDRRREGDEEGELYYALADDNPSFVAERLAVRVTGGGSECGWLTLLDSVVAAPRNRARLTPGTSAMEEVRAMLGSPPAPRTLLTLLAQLVTSLWIAGDPLCGSRRRSLHLQIAADYVDLSRFAPNCSEQLLERARTHQNEAENWK